MSSNEWSNRAFALGPRPPAAALHGAIGLGLWSEVLAVAALALAVRVLWLGAEAHIDELYHLLAAQSWLDEGVPRIAGGTYERAFWYTAIVGWSLETLGDGLAAARWPSVVAGTALVVAVFLWTRRVAGSVAAWTAALLLALSPLAVELSQLARFYALHALAFWLGALCLWRAADESAQLRPRLALAALAAACLMLAVGLQVLTLVGLAGLGLWLGGLWLAPAWGWLRAGGAFRLVPAIAVATGAVVAFGLVANVGMLDPLIEKYRSTPLWAAEFQNQVHFYHARLLQQYPLFWPLTPLALLGALIWRPRVAALCASVFGTSFVLGSFAGMKDDRYLFYALPFLFVLWGTGLAAFFGQLCAAVPALIERACATASPWLPARPTRYAVLAGVLGFLFLSTGAPAQLVLDLAKGDTPQGPGRVSPDWAHAGAALGPWLERADVVVTTNELAALRHLGRADVLISGSRLSELDHGEFSRDWRTGVSVISTPAAFQQLIRCPADGLVLLSARDLAFAWAVRPDVLAAIEDRAMPLPTPGLSELRAYWWEGQPADGGGCPPRPGG